MCAVLPPGDNAIAVNKYIISYQLISDTTVYQLWMLYIKVNLGVCGKVLPLIDKTYTLNYNGPTQLQFHFVFHTRIKLSLSLNGMRIFKNKMLKIISGAYRQQ
jgi:hypothetical protein